MLTVVVMPEITKRAGSSIIYLPVNMASQMDFFFYLKDIFSYVSVVV